MKHSEGFGHPFTAALTAELLVVIWIFVLAAFLVNSQGIVETIWSLL